VHPSRQASKRFSRFALSSVSASVLLALAAPAAMALDLKLDNGWTGTLSTTVSAGTSIRAQEADKKLFSAADGLRVGIAGGTGGSNTDSGTLNYAKGDAFSTLVKVTSDLSLSKGQMGAFARVRAWYDDALENGNVRAGNHGSNYARNKPLSDDGFEPLQKFTGIALLDAYVYNTYNVGGMPMQLRLGNQVINWGESLFIQGVNQINPIDLSALRKPGAEVKDAFLPIASLSANLGLGGGKSLEAFYQFRQTPSNIDSCGTYFGVVETKLSSDNGGACGRMLVAATSSFSNADAFNGGLYVPLGKGREGEDNQYGIAFRMPFEKLDAELGFYAAKLSSRTPIVSGITGDSANPTVRTFLMGLPSGAGSLTSIIGQRIPASLQSLNALPAHAALGLRPFRGFWEYPGSIDVYAASASTNLAGWSLAGEVSVVPNQPAQINGNDLLAGALLGAGPMASTALAATVRGAGNEVSGYRRINKSQVQVNGIKILPRILGSAQSVFVGEAAFQTADIGNSYSGLRFGRAFIFGYGKHATTSGTCNNGAGLNPQVDGCQNDGYVTDNSWGYRLRLSMEYPGFLGTKATFYPTLSFSHDVSGYSVDSQFIEGRQTLGLSGRLNINKVHNIELNYISYADSAKYDPFRDRDFYSVVFSTTF